MKLSFFMLLIFSVGVAWGDAYGTYQDTDGKTKRLKSLDGKDHQFTGHIAPGNDLRGADLRNANLFKANLRGVDLSEANLSGSYLRESLLDGAILNGTVFEGANLNFATISRIGLAPNQIAATNFRNATMSGTRFRHLVGWRNADWKGAVFDKNHPPICPPGIVPQQYGVRCCEPKEVSLRPGSPR